jgi:hypothetical protein
MAKALFAVSAPDASVLVGDRALRPRVKNAG